MSLFIAVLWFEENRLSIATEERYFPLFALCCMTCLIPLLKNCHLTTLLIIFPNVCSVREVCLQTGTAGALPS
jgi:hypothetical protein